jgi:hypothetical protein
MEGITAATCVFVCFYVNRKLPKLFPNLGNSVYNIHDFVKALGWGKNITKCVYVSAIPTELPHPPFISLEEDPGCI